jgi:hypothetical protein
VDSLLNTRQVLHALSEVTASTSRALEAKLARVEAAGGTQLADGFQAGLNMLSADRTLGGRDGSESGGKAKSKPRTPAKAGKKKAAEAAAVVHAAVAEAAEAIDSAGAAAAKPTVVSRVIFLTDMESGQGDEDAVLALAAAAASSGDGRHPVFSSLIGIGVDLSVGAVQAISTTIGGGRSDDESC